MNYSQLKKSLSEKREGLYVEYKRQISDPRKLARAVAAIANSSGGMLYIGVEESDNGKPDIIGVKYDETTHNKDRIINILTDRIEPKIPRLEVESVPRGNRKNSLYVFIISIPPSTLVHGVKDDVAVWKYYIRRPARVDELDPGALLELCKQKNSYNDNMKTRFALLNTINTINEDLARILGVREKELRPILADIASFKTISSKARMRDISLNLVDTFYDLQSNIDYAIKIPHGNLNVEEREILEDISKNIQSGAPEVQADSAHRMLSFGGQAEFLDLSIIGWVRYAIGDSQVKLREDIWNQIIPMLTSYEITLQDFKKELNKLGFTLTQYYEDQFCKSLFRTIRSVCKSLDRLENYYDNLQKSFGSFND